MIPVTALPKIQRRLFALAILALVLAIAWWAMIGRIASMMDRQTEWRADAVSTLARYRTFASERETIDSHLTKLRAHELWQKLYTGNDPSIAISALQGDVRSLLSAQGVSVQLMQPLVTEVEGELAKPGVRINATLTISQLHAFMQALATAPHALRIGELKINAPQFQPADQNPPLSAIMEIYGFMRVPREGGT